MKRRITLSVPDGEWVRMSVQETGEILESGSLGSILQRLSETLTYGKLRSLHVHFELTPQVSTIPCGGCGAVVDKDRCTGCLHDFGTQESAWVRSYGP